MFLRLLIKGAIVSTSPCPWINFRGPWPNCSLLPLRLVIFCFGGLKLVGNAGSGLTEITRGESLRALRCGTFRGTGVDRLLVTGDFTGRSLLLYRVVSDALINANFLFRLDVWDPEDPSAAVDGVVAHEELINSITGSIEGGRVATGSRDGRVGLHFFN